LWEFDPEFNAILKYEPMRIYQKRNNRKQRKKIHKGAIFDKRLVTDLGVKISGKSNHIRCIQAMWEA